MSKRDTCCHAEISVFKGASVYRCGLKHETCNPRGCELYKDSRLVLKRCPFCGGRADMSRWEKMHEYSAYCTKCHAVPGDYCDTELAAAKLWNRRFR